MSVHNARKRPLPGTTGKPEYVGQAGVAHFLGVHRAVVGNWLRRWPEEIPQPDAYIENRVPLWLTERLPEWRRWQKQGID